MNWGVALELRRRDSSSTIFPMENQREALRRCGVLVKGRWVIWSRELGKTCLAQGLVHGVCHGDMIK
jgi:hypothetical protein